MCWGGRRRLHWCFRRRWGSASLSVELQQRDLADPITIRDAEPSAFHLIVEVAGSQSFAPATSASGRSLVRLVRIPL